MTAGWSPLALSFWVATWAGVLALVAGTAVAWLLAHGRFRGKVLLEGLVMLPLVLPPTVLGFYLLVALGQRGIGPWVEQWLGFRFVFAWPGAVAAAAIAALPLATQAIRASLAEVSREIEEAGRVDGCNRWQLFWKISLPLAWRGLLVGGTLGFLRALGDFGASLMVAGNIPQRTQTMPMAIYDAVQANDLARANSLVWLLSLIVFGLLFVVLRFSAHVTQSR
jgi:molybdate transport system permease protein